MKLDAMKRQAGRPSKNDVPVAQDLRGRTSRQITNLIPGLFDFVDNFVLKEKDKLRIALRPWECLA